MIMESELDIRAEVGSGAYGSVYKSKYRGTDVAVKKLNITGIPEQVLKEFYKELKLLKSMRHPNITLL